MCDTSSVAWGRQVFDRTQCCRGSVMVISVGAGGVGWCLSKSVYTVIGKNSIGGDCCGNIQKHCYADLQYGLQKSACKP